MYSLLYIFLLSQSDGSYGLDYFMAKVNLDTLKDNAGQSLDIKPINPTDTVAVVEGDLVSVIQHALGDPKGTSHFTVSGIIGNDHGYFVAHDWDYSKRVDINCFQFSKMRCSFSG